MKDLMIQRMEEAPDEQLAHKLGITYEELISLNHIISTEESADGLIYNYIISFDDRAPKEVLAKIKNIDRNNKVWLSAEQFNSDYYYEEQYESIISNKYYYENFLEAISFSEKLNNIDIDGGQLTTILKRQIYISIIAALEAFLSENFINLTAKREEYFRNFVESYPDFKQRKIELSRVFVEQERIKETAKKVMVEVIYHNLAKVERMYVSTFKIEFPKISELSKCVNIRHDLVHRNGKTKDGEILRIDQSVINDLIEKVRTFVQEINNKLLVVK